MEQLQIEELKNRVTEKKSFLTTDEVTSKFFVDCNYFGAPRVYFTSEIFNEEFGQNFKRNAIFANLENLCAKNSQENKLKLRELFIFYPETNLKKDFLKEKFFKKSPTPSIQQKENQKSSDDSWDEIVEEAINKYDISTAKRTKTFKDAFAQTIFNAPGTTDSQCQCDLVLSEASTLILTEDPSTKKRKLKVQGFHFVDDEARSQIPDASESLQNGGENSDVNYSASQRITSNQKANSRIRIGLSKRCKPRPLHNKSSI